MGPPVAAPATDTGGGRVNRDPDERAQPDGAAAPDEFEAIVSRWRREGPVPVWPDDEDQMASLFEPESTPAPRQPSPEEDHFVPPEPPPLPPIGPPALVGLTLLGLGLLLVTTPGWLGVPQPYGLPLGLVSIAAGLGWLVLRLWPDPPVPMDGSDSDDGAVL
jgi:hypothetical protein